MEAYIYHSNLDMLSPLYSGFDDFTIEPREDCLVMLFYNWIKNGKGGYDSDKCFTVNLSKLVTGSQITIYSKKEKREIFFYLAP